MNLNIWGDFKIYISIPLSFVRKEKFLKSDGLKSNHENVMKSSDRIPSHQENEGNCFLGDSLNKNIPRKK